MRMCSTDLVLLRGGRLLMPENKRHQAPVGAFSPLLLLPEENKPSAKDLVSENHYITQFTRIQGIGGDENLSHLHPPFLGLPMVVTNKSCRLGKDCSPNNPRPFLEWSGEWGICRMQTYQPWCILPFIFGEVEGKGLVGDVLRMLNLVMCLACNYSSKGTSRASLHFGHHSPGPSGL